MSASVFDARWDGQRTRLSAFLPANLCLCFQHRRKKIGLQKRCFRRKCPLVPLLRSVRLGRTLPLGELSLLTHGLYELPMKVRHASELDNNAMNLDQSLFSEPDDHGVIVSVQEAQW